MRLKWIAGAVALLVGVIIATVLIMLSRYDFNALKPQITRIAQETTGRELTLGGDIDLKIGLAPKLLVENVSFQNAAWGSRPAMIKVRRVEAQVALLPLLSQNIEIKHLILVEPDILIETDQTGQTNLEFKISPKETAPKSKKQAAEPGKSELPVLKFEDLRIANGRLTYKDARKNKTLAIKIEDLNARTTDPAGTLVLNLHGDYNGIPFEVESTMGSLVKLTDPDRDWPLQLTVKALETTLALDGTIQNLSGPDGFQFQVSLASKHPAAWGQLVGKPVPLKTPVDISAHLAGPGPDIYELSDLKAVAGDSRLNGSLTANLASPVPQLSASLASPNLDLRPLFPKKKDQKEKGADKPAPQRRKVFSDAPLPFAALKAVDAEVNLKIGRLLTPTIAAGDIELNMILKNGHMTLKPVKAHIGGGTLNGQVDLRPRRQTAVVTAVVKIDRLDVGSMLHDLGATKLLEGRMNADVNLKAKGGSIAALMAGLNGRTRVIMNNGRINNKYINLLGGDLTSGVYRLVNPRKEKTDNTQINCFVNIFDIKDGLADSTALVLSTADMNVIGDGEIHLDTEKLDFSLKPVPKEGVAGVSLSLSELTKPFKLGGTLANPSLRIDPTQTAIAIGKAVGGMTLFGPLGIAAALVGGKSNDENPCLTAIEKAQESVTAKPSGKKGATVQNTDGVTETLKGFGERLKGLFGD